MIQMSIPKKMQDPNNFTLPCTNGGFEFKKVLCHSGACINFIPLLVVKRLSLRELNPTAMTLKMEDRTMT